MFFFLLPFFTCFIYFILVFLSHAFFYYLFYLLAVFSLFSVIISLFFIYQLYFSLFSFNIISCILYLFATLFLYLLCFMMYLGTNVNINENLALHTYLFIPLLCAKTQKKNSVVESKEKRTLILIQRHYEKSLALSLFYHALFFRY